MNFFKAQDKARKHTRSLIFLFILAVVSLIALTNLLLIGTLAFLGGNEEESFYSTFVNSVDVNTIIVISIGVSLLVIIGSLFKIYDLSKGGSAIAEMLGGQLVPQSTDKPDERKLLNIVEEKSMY